MASQHENVSLPGAQATPAIDPVGGMLKRGLDVAVALTALVLLLPLLVLVSLLVLATMGRPIFERQKRVGFGGRAFGCYKFRTTETTADEALPRDFAAAATEARQEPQKLSNDPHLTRLGQLLRRAGIDELPQLINVLKGEMSCVGPQPLASEELQCHRSEAGPYLRARPGMTGISEGSWYDAVCDYDRVALDSAYVNNWSLRDDIVILLKTIPAVVRVKDNVT